MGKKLPTGVLKKFSTLTGIPTANMSGYIGDTRPIGKKRAKLLAKACEELGIPLTASDWAFRQQDVKEIITKAFANGTVKETCHQDA